MGKNDYFEDLMREQKRSEERKQKAVALEYEMGIQPAPKIVASGVGTMAEQIIAIAEKHGIPLHKDENLVEILGALDVDSFIPLEAYVTVAEILNFIYKARK